MNKIFANTNLCTDVIDIIISYCDKFTQLKLLVILMYDNYDILHFLGDYFTICINFESQRVNQYINVIDMTLIINLNINPKIKEVNIKDGELILISDIKYNFKENDDKMAIISGNKNDINNLDNNSTNTIIIPGDKIIYNKNDIHNFGYSFILNLMKDDDYYNLYMVGKIDTCYMSGIKPDDNEFEKKIILNNPKTLPKTILVDYPYHLCTDMYINFKLQYQYIVIKKWQEDIYMVNGDITFDGAKNIMIYDQQIMVQHNPESFLYDEYIDNDELIYIIINLENVIPSLLKHMKIFQQNETIECLFYDGHTNNIFK